MIKGFRGTSLIDYPGKIAGVIYTYGCNFRCPYCYNIELVLPEEYNKLEDIPEEFILQELSRRKNFIKGVVITGGEPTLWGKRLINFIEKIYYELGLSVKLDTNGSNPDLIKVLFEMELLDFLALDFKTSPQRYSEIGGDFKKVAKTFEIAESKPEKVEIRITFYPPLVSQKDLEDMLPYLRNFKFIAFQKYVPGKTLERKEVPLYSQDFYIWAKNLFKEKLPHAEIVERF
ncbi:MAG: anaerobic ribonucleoside-triphosphate reductase activating protein [Thermodesulfobacterium geofontis]|uniref:Anaerobic ribonucleoside-triphosphate reductase activating protein n=1 Tax=Thermodesulfobacterium geofontis TaxID=1295609 RepID=A0A2N7Q632_9BACT|nr:MAG: anaerobic ribonucleoside-triphosphate reductase activating protein [Thermodesulfobacterium geofontis]PMP93516.1 MAG: anaerobic ribonucleoside-triphosphate reductase activating protein [Thermodesulfobacterium geofontis]